jgi:hypothetical protein
MGGSRFLKRDWGGSAAKMVVFDIVFAAFFL